MNFRQIQRDGKVYALVAQGKDLPDGLQFLTADSAFLQLGTWKYNNGKILKAHAHKICERTSNITQEFILVRRGKLRMDVYDDNDTVLESLTLEQGDFALLFCGGHGYEILADGTEVVEVKNGPYPGLELDKRAFA